MAVRKKIHKPGFVHFITFTICRWQSVFTEERYTDLIYKWFDYQRARYENRIHGYVIMPNHFHGLIYLSDKSPPINKLIQNAKRFLAYEIVHLHEEDGNEDVLRIFKENARMDKGAKHKVFEERYDSKVIDNGELYLQKLEYIHNNPCRSPWNLVELPEKYPHSSAGDYHGKRGGYGFVDKIW
jgi:putative transposase